MEAKNKKSNEVSIKKIADALGDLNEQVVFVGGAVISLYVEGAFEDDVRPTRDVDIFVEIASYGKLTSFQEKLIAKGFSLAMDEDVMCRFKYKDVLVDIMATKEVGWAPADKWFEPGLRNLSKVNVLGTDISILDISYFLATKFNAFQDRKEDPRLSKHFEDIIYILDNRRNLLDDIVKAPTDVNTFLISEFRKLNTEEYHEAILAHLPFDSQTERFKDIIETVRNISEL